MAIAEFEGLVNRYNWGMTRFVLTFQAVQVLSNSGAGYAGFISGVRSDEAYGVVYTPYTQSHNEFVPQDKEAEQGAIGIMAVGLIVLACLGFGGFLLFGKFIQKNVTIYQVSEDDVYSLLAKIHLPDKAKGLNLNELPEKIRNRITESRFVVELANSVGKRFRGRTFEVAFRDYSISEYINPTFDMKTYQIDADFGFTHE